MLTSSVKNYKHKFAKRITRVDLGISAVDYRYANDAAESVDYDRCAEHAVYLAKAGIKGLVVQGSTGESACLSVEEKESLIKATRDALDKNGYQSTVVIAGIGGQCLQESLALARGAARAGASHGLALSPSFFAGQMTDAILTKYFIDLADGSPIPFIIYNFPGVTNGINLSSSVLSDLSRHPHIVGTKLTCNTVSKIQYLHPEGGNLQGTFQVFTGSSEFLAAARAAGAIGAISGLSNMFPYTLVKLYSLIETDPTSKEVLRLQSLVTHYEGIMMKSFIPGNRATMELLGFPAGHSRNPLPDATPEEVEYYKKNIKAIAAEEKKLAEAA